MLTRLYIKDFAIVDELEIYFENSFQVITGETGAGKSILVGAMALLCGDRGHADLVRSGSAKAILEAEFKIDQKEEIKSLLAAWDVEFYDESIILRREINKSGMSRAFVNDSPVSINHLGKISSFLIDLHGQHQHQRLIHPETHIDYLDAFGRLVPILEQYRTAFDQYYKTKKDLESLIELRKASYEKHDLYAYQIDELDKANLREDELEHLAQEYNILENSETLFETTQSVSEILYLSDNSVQKNIMQAITKLRQIGGIDKKFSEILNGLESAQVAIEEIGQFCEQYNTSLEFNPQRLEEIRTRESELNFLLKKYQVETVAQLIRHGEEMKYEIGLIEDYDEKIDELTARAGNEQVNLQKQAILISEKRRISAKNFEKQLGKLLDSVGLKNIRFHVQIDWKEDSEGDVLIDEKSYALSNLGLDNIEFFVGINVGEPLRPLHKIASGGEISRIMLCIKSLIADSDEIGTLVFDEIDVGISGRFAQIVGSRMREISNNHQLIVITHLPQIAAQGRAHYSVVKTEQNGRTKVSVKKLDYEARITDIAKLLSGENITDNTLANARELLSSQEQV
jgi:DNA repair protein RecN (Recombination protein N)